MKNNILFLFFLLVGSGLFAQNIVKFQIKDETRLPIIGANIIVNGTNIGTATDINGIAELPINKGENFNVSSIGYQTLNIEYKGENSYNLVMKTDQQVLLDVVLVGTRNPKRSKLESPVPVDIININSLKNLSPQNTLNDILTVAVPSFNSNRQSASDGTEHIDPASLRGLGPDQVLVLVDGIRRHTTSLVNYQNTVGNGSVGTDISSIPTSAIERIEVLRDGASAQYGSDAIAGVINIILKRSHQNQLSIGYGQTKESDGKTFNASYYSGAKLRIGNKTGNISTALEYNNRGNTNRTQNHDLIIYDQSSLDRYFAYPFTDDAAASKAYDDAQIKANGLSRDDFNFHVGDAQIKNIYATINTDLELSDKWEIFANFILNNRKGTGFGFRRLPSEGSVVLDLFPNGFQPELKSDVKDNSFCIGLRGTLGNWKTTLSNNTGSNDFKYKVENTNNASLGASSPTKFNAGGHSFLQNTTNLDFHQNIDWMSGLSLSFGGEFRYEKYKISAGEPNSYSGSGAESFPGFSDLNAVNENRTNVGFYADVEADLTKKFSLGFASRFENYSDFGSTINGKLTMRYSLIPQLALRGAVSNGFRAPSLHQRYFNNIATIIVDGSNVNSGIFRNDSEVAKQLGIPELKEEKSKNYSLGLTYSPTSAFTLTLDAYKIDINDRIILTGDLGNDPYGDAVPELQNIFKQYNALSGRFFTNAIDTKTKGIDLVANYRKEFEKGNLDFSFSYNYNKNEVTHDLSEIPTTFKDQVDVYFGPQERSLIESNTPNHKFTAQLLLGLGKFNFMIRDIYYGEVTRNGFPFGVEQKHKGKMVTDMSIAYQLINNLTFTIGANNLFNVFPDNQVYDNSYFGVFKYAPVQMGTTGAYYFAKLGYSF